MTDKLRDKGTAEVRKRTRSHASKSEAIMDISAEQEDVTGGSGTYTVSRDLTFRNGEWRERNVVETAVIVTEPRVADKQDRDDGDSGISETAAEEHLLPRGIRREEGGGGGGGSAPEYVNGKKETVLETLIQVFIPFMIAGFGMMAAGLLLDEVQVCLCSMSSDITADRRC